MRRSVFIRGINKIGALEQQKRVLALAFLPLSSIQRKVVVNRGGEVRGRNILGKEFKLKLIGHFRLIKGKQ